MQYPILNQCITVICSTLTEELVVFSGECANVRPNYYLMRPNRQINGLIIKVLHQALLLIGNISWVPYCELKIQDYYKT